MEKIFSAHGLEELALSNDHPTQKTTHIHNGREHSVELVFERLMLEKLGKPCYTML